MEAWPVHAHLHSYTFRYANISSAEGALLKQMHWTPQNKKRPNSALLYTTPSAGARASSPTATHSQTDDICCVHVLLGQSSLFWSWKVFFCSCASSGTVGATQTFLCILSLRAFKQHIDSCFQYLSDLSRGSWSCESLHIHHKCACYHQPSVCLQLPCFSIIWRQLSNTCTKCCCSDLRWH